MICRKILEKNDHLLQAFILLGSEQEGSDNVITSLEEYAYKL